MSVAATRRTMGLTVPVTEVLNAQKWRERYAYGVILGQGEQSEDESALDALLGCKAPTKALTAGGQTTAAQSLITEMSNELPDDVIRWHLRTALSELEIMLGTPMGVVVRKAKPVDTGLVLGVDYDEEIPRQPFLVSEQANFYRIDLPAGVISVERVRAFWYDNLVWSISANDNNAGLLEFEHPGTSSLHILPTQSASLLIAAPTLGAHAYGAMQLIGGSPSGLPGVWAVDYTLGPRNRYGPAGHIPVAAAHWAYCKAGVLLLSLGGMGSSRGLTSASLSIDGLSKSVGLQSSAIYGVNSALEQRLKEAQGMIDRLRTYMRGLRIRPYGH